jgi:hypothetical protein
MFEREVDVLYFRDTKRQFIVNVTNADILMDSFGEEPGNWAGKSVTLFLEEYGNAGKHSIRVRAAQATDAKAITVPTRPTTSPRRDMDDEIPF